MTQKAIKTKISDGIPYPCNAISNNEYRIAIPENLGLLESKLYANISELSRLKNISSINTSFYKHNNNRIYTIEVFQDDCDFEEHDWWVID